MAMDVVDTIRHADRLVERELGGEERQQRLRERLREIYQSQGIEVSDHVLDQGITALEEKRFAYTPKGEGWKRSLATAWATRSRWGRYALAGLGVLRGRLGRLAFHRRRAAPARGGGDRAGTQHWPAAGAARRARPRSGRHAGCHRPRRCGAAARGRRGRRPRRQPAGSPRAPGGAERPRRAAGRRLQRAHRQPAGRTLGDLARAGRQSARAQLLPDRRGDRPRRPPGGGADHQRGGWPHRPRLPLGPACAGGRVRARAARQAGQWHHRAAGHRREGRRHAWRRAGPCRPTGGPSCHGERRPRPAGG